jgi:hypothetical protein
MSVKETTVVFRIEQDPRNAQVMRDMARQVRELDAEYKKATFGRMSGEPRSEEPAYKRATASLLPDREQFFQAQNRQEVTHAAKLNKLITDNNDKALRNSSLAIREGMEKRQREAERLSNVSVGRPTESGLSPSSKAFERELDKINSDRLKDETQKTRILAAVAAERQRLARVDDRANLRAGSLWQRQGAGQEPKASSAELTRDETQKTRVLAAVAAERQRIADQDERLNSKAGTGWLKEGQSVANDRERELDRASAQTESFTRKQGVAGRKILSYSMSAAEGILNLTKGVAMLGLVGEKDTKKLVDGLLKLEGGFSIAQGGFATLVSLSKAWSMLQRSATLAAEAQKAAAVSGTVAKVPMMAQLASLAARFALPVAAISATAYAGYKLGTMGPQREAERSTERLNEWIARGEKARLHGQQQLAREQLPIEQQRMTYEYQDKYAKDAQDLADKEAEYQRQRLTQARERVERLHSLPGEKPYQEMESAQQVAETATKESEDRRKSHIKEMAQRTKEANLLREATGARIKAGEIFMETQQVKFPKLGWMDRPGGLEPNLRSYLDVEKMPSNAGKPRKDLTVSSIQELFPGLTEEEARRLPANEIRSAIKASEVSVMRQVQRPGYFQEQYKTQTKTSIQTMEEERQARMQGQDALYQRRQEIEANIRQLEGQRDDAKMSRRGSLANLAMQQPWEREEAVSAAKRIVESGFDYNKSGLRPEQIQAGLGQLDPDSQKKFMDSMVNTMPKVNEEGWMAWEKKKQAEIDKETALREKANSMIKENADALQKLITNLTAYQQSFLSMKIDSMLVEINNSGAVNVNQKGEGTKGATASITSRLQDGAIMG